MPNTKITQKKWQNHMQYGKTMYIVIALVGFLVADLIYTMTAYHAPNERKVDVELVLSYSDATAFDTVAQEALAVGQAFDETLEEVNFVDIAYDPDDSSDYYGSQKFMVMLAAQEGDIYIMPYSLVESLAEQGTLVSLDDYIEQGVIDPQNTDLASVTFYEPEDDDGNYSDVQHVYAISCEGWYGMMEEPYSIDNRELYACIMAFSKNQDTTARVLQFIQEQMTAEKPDWVIAAEEKATEEEAIEEEETVEEETIE